MIVALVGLPGSGKSTVGRQLARRLKTGFFDYDQVIERELGCSIRVFFEREGEAAFRDHEEQVIDTLTSAGTSVLATGGGAVLRPANRAHLHGRTRVVYLRSTPEEIFRRLRHDRNRPLLQVADPLARLRALIDRVLAQAGIGADRVETVFLTGGSSRLPALRQLLAAMLPGARLDSGDDFGSVGTGLALEARRRYG